MKEKKLVEFEHETNNHCLIQISNFQIQCTDNNGAWNGTNSIIIQQERKKNYSQQIELHSKLALYWAENFTIIKILSVLD